MPSSPHPPPPLATTSTPALVAGVLADAKEMAAVYLGRMRGEVRDEFRELKRFLMKVAIAVGIGILGAVLLAHTAALALTALGFPEWVGYLIASGLALGAGAVALHRLPHDTHDRDLFPETTIDALRRDVRSLKDEVVAEVKADGHPIGAY